MQKYNSELIPYRNIISQCIKYQNIKTKIMQLLEEKKQHDM